MAFELNRFNDGQISPQFLAEINMEQAVQAAEKRVQEEADKTVKIMQETLRQSQANNRTLAERIVLKDNEIEMLKQQLKGLQERAKKEKQEQERFMQAYKARFNDLAANVNATCAQIIEDAQDDIQKKEANFKAAADGGYVSPVTLSWYREDKDEHVGKMNKIIDGEKSIQNQIKQFEKKH